MKINLRRIIDTSYEIKFVRTIADAASDIRSSYPSASIFTITDSNVAKYYGRSFVKSLRGKAIPILKIQSGEASKSRKTKEYLEDKLIALGAERDSVIVALGGGVIGDVAGFVAATLHRGVPFIQIPTSLLAQVDSSIGGKVAVDHPLGKNLIGAFYQPKKVYISPSTLKTLPEEEFRSGMAEVIKYAVILDGTLMVFLEKNRLSILQRKPAVMRTIIERCCELKRRVVEKDEFESDYRRILNFGHTIGHAIEQVSHYRIPHGKAVAMGMIAEAKLSVKMGMLSQKEAVRLERILTAFGLQTIIPPSIKTSMLFDATLQDKKMRNGSVQYTLLQKIGNAHVGVPLTQKHAQELFEQ